MFHDGAESIFLWLKRVNMFKTGLISVKTLTEEILEQSIHVKLEDGIIAEFGLQSYRSSTLSYPKV